MQTKKSWTSPTQTSQLNPQQQSQRFPSFVQFQKPQQKKSPSFHLPKSLKKSGQQISKSLIKQMNRHQCIMIQSQLRKIYKNIIIEQSLIKNKKILNQLQLQLQSKSKQIFFIKRNIINKRIQELMQNKILREVHIKKSNQQIYKIKQIQSKKMQSIQKIIKCNKEKYKQFQSKQLKQRKKLLIPINFSQLSSHASKYKKPKTNNQSPLSNQFFSTQNQQQQQPPNKFKSKILTNLKTPTSQNYITKISAKKNCLSQRSKEVQRIKGLKQIRQKSQEYGNKAQKLYHKKKSKTQSIPSFKLPQKIKSEQINKKKKSVQPFNKIHKFRLPYKPKPSHFHHQPQIQSKTQIQQIKHSNQPTQQKLQKLTQLSQIQFNRIRLKGRYIDLQHLNKINITRAQILLNMQ